MFTEMKEESKNMCREQKMIFKNDQSSQSNTSQNESRVIKFLKVKNSLTSGWHIHKRINELEEKESKELPIIQHGEIKRWKISWDSSQPHS